MLIIKSKQNEEILAHSIAALPNESCGLLAGTIEGDNKIVQKVYLLRNIDESPEHFSMDVEEQFKAIADIRKNKWQLLGNFHSHPMSPSRPSDEDIRLAFDPNLSYIILSLQDSSNPVINSFKIINQTVSREEIKILE
ncbi:M67 family metallopeptidase [Ruminiclostridium josui]|uniref:M67 family metallopeptidase n=1 Tax=Ruminiclostridium josui TaxID=1499 RepID=UPI000464E8D5|nr:M67 family metallopeptidase [Ruminiclostridium josui]